MKECEGCITGVSAKHPMCTVLRWPRVVDCLAARLLVRWRSWLAAPSSPCPRLHWPKPLIGSLPRAVAQIRCGTGSSGADPGRSPFPDHTGRFRR